MRHWGVVLVWCLLLLAWPLAAGAQQTPAPTNPATLPQRRANFVWDPKGTPLRASLSYRDIVDAEVQRKLQSGLPTVVVMWGYIYADSKPDTPVAGVVKSCRVAFDVWNEVYRLEIKQVGLETTAVAVNVEGVLRRCAEVRDFPIVEKDMLQPGGSYFLASIVEVNPISKEMLERIRRWVSRPPGSSVVTPGDSLFGSFVGLFVARIGEADRTLQFRTQSFTVPR